MRIGILSQWYDPEPGPAAVPGVVARGLRDAGHEVIVLTGFPNYPTGELAPGYRIRPHVVEHLEGIEVHRVALYPSHDRSAVGRAANYGSFALSAAIAALPVLGRVDAIWIYNSPITVGLPAAVLQLVGRVPTVLHVQDLWPDSVVASGLLPGGRAGRLVAGAIGRWAAMTYRLASTVAVISPGMGDLLVTRGVPAAKISWLPNCADESLFRAVEYDSDLAEEVGAVGRFTLMYGGSLGDVQALDTAIRAAALLRDRPKFRLLFVGSGVAEASLRDLALELRADNVEFLGRRPANEMAALMRVADAQLISLDDQPFLAATMPSKVQSVLATGRPVVVCARGDVASLIDDAGAGVTCPPNNPAALAQSFRHLIDAPADELLAMGDRGLSYYWKHLASTRMSERLVDLCADAAGIARAAAVVDSSPSGSVEESSDATSADGGRGEQYRVFAVGRRQVAAYAVRPKSERMRSAALYQGGTRRRAAVRAAMLTAVATRLDSVVTRRTGVPLGSSLQDAVDAWTGAAARVLGIPKVDITYMWPPQADRGRCYAYLSKRSGAPVAFAKLSFDAANDRSLRRERDLLSRLQSPAHPRFSTPPVLAMLPFGDHECLVTGPLPATARPIGLRRLRYPAAVVAQYRGPIRVLRRHEVECSSWWRGALTDLNPAAPFSRELSTAVDAGVEVCTAHGDLSPANMVGCPETLWLIDWEDGADDAPRWADRVAFALATSRHDSGRSRRWLATVLAPGPGGAVLGTNRQRAVLGLAYRYARGFADATAIVNAWTVPVRSSI